MTNRTYTKLLNFDETLGRMLHFRSKGFKRTLKLLKMSKKLEGHWGEL